MSESNKILVLIDGSDRSKMTVGYIAEVESFKTREIVLYHVYSEIPECYWDMDNDPVRPNALKGFEAWKKEKLETIEAFMQEA